MADAPLVYIIAGEASGDDLGAALIAALKARTGGRIRFAGIGGDRMAAEGLTSLFPMEELSIIGLAEVLPRIRQLRRRIAQTIDDVVTRRPAAVVTIDSAGFNMRVVRGARARGVPGPFIHYVAPMTWAWGHWRRKKLVGKVDHLMALWDWEPPVFEQVGLPTTWVGHSLLERQAHAGDGPAWRAAHDVPADAPLLCALPGSRGGEVGRLLPVFAAVVARLAENRPDLRVVVPTVPAVADKVAAATAHWPVPVIPETKAGKYDAFAAADVALAASGTVTLELATARLPMVVTYKVSAATAVLARRLLKVKYASLVNIVSDAMIVPERLQEHCRPDLIAADLERLWLDGPDRRDQLSRLEAALGRLGLAEHGTRPSERAADTVLRLIRPRESPI